MSTTIEMHTSAGTLRIELDDERAPLSAANFADYVRKGHYDGTIFHRVIDGFVIQGGGFTAGLSPKNPTYAPIQLEISNLKHVDGAISMARTMDPNSATSQFYICDGPQAGLDGNYAVFGALIDGFDVLASISAVQTTTNGQYMDVPVQDIVVNDAYCVGSWP